MTHEEFKAKYPPETRLIQQGWVCHDERVKRVWFVGYLVGKPEDKRAGMMLMMEFYDGGFHEIDSKECAGEEGDLFELLAQKGDEFLRRGTIPQRNLKDAVVL